MAMNMLFSSLVFVFVLSLQAVASPTKERSNSCKSFTDYSSSSQGNPVVSQFGPCSPFKNSTRKHNFTELIHRDRARVKWIESRFEPGVSFYQTSLPAYSGIPLGALEYVVKIGLGTPKQDFVVLFDTGSDVTWVQCEPCEVSCHAQNGPRFDPSGSHTFQYYSCDAPDCLELNTEGDRATCSQSRCVYQIRYGDGSTHSVGYFGRDTLTLTNTDVFANFPFGCGIDQAGSFGKEAGLLGLGRNMLSLVNLTSKYYNGVFSYCLPSTPDSVGFLTFGPDPGSESASFTPMGQNPRAKTFYFVKLQSISVAGKMVQINPLVLLNTTILDSGTSLTFLQAQAYAALKSAFNESMSKYKEASPIGGLDTCYDLSTATNESIPESEITFHFEGGAKLEMDFTNTMIYDRISQACLAFVSSSTIGIIGNWQQKRTQVIFDLAQTRVGFRPGACS